MGTIKKIFYSEDKYGIKQGNDIIVPAIYDKISDNLSSHTKVRKGEKCGYVDQDGNILIDCIYDDIYYLFADYYAVRQNDSNVNESEDSVSSWKFGVINQKGEVVIDFLYEYIEPMGSFILCYEKVDSKKYKYNYSYVESYSYEKEGYKCIVLSHMFREIYNGFVFSLEGNYLLVSESKNGELVLIDEEGVSLFKKKFDYIEHFKNDLFVVRETIGEDCFFYIIRSDESLFVDIKYGYISVMGSYLHCYNDVRSEEVQDGIGNNKYSYSYEADPIWYNLEGEQIYIGKGDVILDNAIAIQKNGKWGIINGKGKRIINFLYDKVFALDNHIVVSRDNKLGVFDSDGAILLDAVYDSIECVDIHNDEIQYIDDLWVERTKYYEYGVTHPFDTENKHDELFHIILRCKKSVGLSEFNFKKPLVLQRDGIYELFKSSTGLASNSQFDLIQPLTNLSFCVKKNNKYGVYRIDAEELIIPCEYEKIVFEGNHTVLFRKDNLWGAKDLYLESQDTIKKIFGVDIKPRFLSIRILNAMETLFSVCQEYTTYLNEVKKYFTIVDAHGDVLKGFKYDHYESHFKMYDECFYTQLGGKWGFVNSKNQNIIPFLYDEIELRNDNYFNVRIGDLWGVLSVGNLWKGLSITGKEILPIKYSQKIPSFEKNDQIGELYIVEDGRSGKKGIITRQLEEFIPCVYDYLIIDYDAKLIYFAYGVEDECNNFFSGGVYFEDWGCMSMDGQLLIEANYDCFIVQDGYILAGRDGSYLQEGQDEYHNSYSGVYDLYDYDGELIFGGFDHFDVVFHNNEKLFFFQLGGKWIQECEDYDEWGNAIYYYSNHYDDKRSKWLVLNEDMYSIIPRENGAMDKFGRGFIHKIRRVEKNGKITNVWSLQSFEITSEERPYIDCYGALICSQDNKKFAVLIDKSYRTKKCLELEFYEPYKYFYIEDELSTNVKVCKIQILNDEIWCDAVEDINFLQMEYVGGILTLPNKGYFFSVQELENNKCRVILLLDNGEEIEKICDVITLCEKNELFDAIVCGLLAIDFEQGNAPSLASMILPDSPIFDKLFVNSKSSTTSKMVNREKCWTYWFALPKIELDSYRKVSYDYDDTDDRWYDSYDALNDAFEGQVDLYNDWLLG